ncbi:hypothetical protein [Desulfobotulus sp.]|jgi:hypothetical protein|uniref:hypothetical protein n=1 Tax=Desulfobotulus sp. TaxID=1940337 RepID=UPI002A35E8D3|nr:hypothetical protein [Desulfobotulus sp.]MDY0164783.1 hypothetical protein [Desulfobotulus sp.]
MTDYSKDFLDYIKTLSPEAFSAELEKYKKNAPYKIAPDIAEAMLDNSSGTWNDFSCRSFLNITEKTVSVRPGKSVRWKKMLPSTESCNIDQANRILECPTDDYHAHPVAA